MLHDSPIYIEGKRDNVEVEIALQYNDSYAENVFAFANTINTVDGGTHLSGFRSALTRSINNFASAAGMLKEQKDEVTITGDDVREGLGRRRFREAAAAAVRRADQRQAQ